MEKIVDHSLQSISVDTFFYQTLCTKRCRLIVQVVYRIYCPIKTYYKLV